MRRAALCADRTLGRSVASLLSSFGEGFRKVPSSCSLSGPVSRPRQGQRGVPACCRGERLTQTVRHEHVSALILCLPAVRSWLASAGKRIDLDVVVAAVLSHHLKASTSGDWKWGQLHSAKSVRLFLEDGQIASCLARSGLLLEIREKPPPSSSSVSDAAPWSDAWRAGTEAARGLQRDKDPARRASWLPPRRASSWLTLPAQAWFERATNSRGGSMT